MGSFDTFSMGNVLANVDAIRTARLQQEAYGNALADREQEKKDKAARSSAISQAWNTGGKDVGALVGIDPGAAMQMRQYFDGLSKERRDQELADAQTRLEKAGKLSAWVLGAPDDGEAANRYRIARASMPTEQQAAMPEKWDPSIRTQLEGTVAQLGDIKGLLDDIKTGKQAAAMGDLAGAGRALPSDPARFSAAPSAARMEQMFQAAEQQYRLPAGYLAQTAQIESGGNPAAANPNSSARGLFQFIDSTARQYGVDPMDPASSTDGAARLAADNAATLRQALGREPTPGELYLAHQQGGGGAAKLLANPNARAVDVVGADAVRLNGGDPNMTAGQFASKWTSKLDGAGMPAPGLLRNDTPQRPEQDPRLAAAAQLYGLLGAADPLRTEIGKRIMQAQGMGDQFTLTPGDVRFDSAGGQVAAVDTQSQQFRQATPAEASQYGAVAGQFGPDGRFYAENPPSGMTIESDGEGGFRMAQGPGIAASSKPLNEGQSKNVIYATRAEGALPALDASAGALTSRTDQAAGAVPFGLGRGYQDPKYQQAEQAGREFLTAILRKDSGAAITRDEEAIYGDVYLPRPGDAPELLQQKAQSRARAVEALRRGMTPAEILALEKGNPSEPAAIADPGAVTRYRYNPDTDQLEPVR